MSHTGLSLVCESSKRNSKGPTLIPPETNLVKGDHSDRLIVNTGPLRLKKHQNPNQWPNSMRPPIEEAPPEKREGVPYHQKASLKHITTWL